MNSFYRSLVACLACFVSIAQAQPAPSAAPGLTRWTCNAFYLPARSIWKRTVDIEYDADGVRSLMIDGVAAYSFNLQGSLILTAIDGERIQFDVTAQSWTSDLRGVVSSQGKCEREAVTR